MTIVLGGWAHEEPDKTNAMYLTVAGKQNGIVRGFQKAPSIETQPLDVAASDGDAVGFTLEPADDDVSVQWQETTSLVELWQTEPSKDLTPHLNDLLGQSLSKNCGKSLTGVTQIGRAHV